MGASSLDSNFDYSSYGSSAGANSQLESKVQFSQTTAKFDWAFLTDKINDLSDERLHRRRDFRRGRAPSRTGAFLGYQAPRGCAAVRNPSQFQTGVRQLCGIAQPGSTFGGCSFRWTPRPSTTTSAAAGSLPAAPVSGNMSTGTTQPSTLAGGSGEIAEKDRKEVHVCDHIQARGPGWLHPVSIRLCQPV